MATKTLSKRDKKKIRIRKKISGTAERPRLAVFRSNLQIYAQLIDDSESKTIVSTSSLSKDLADSIKEAKGKIAKSELVGEDIAKKALELGVKEVVFATRLMCTTFSFKLSIPDTFLCLNLISLNSEFFKI